MKAATSPSFVLLPDQFPQEAAQRTRTEFDKINQMTIRRIGLTSVAICCQLNLKRYNGTQKLIFSCIPKCKKVFFELTFDKTFALFLFCDKV